MWKLIKRSISVKPLRGGRRYTHDLEEYRSITTVVNMGRGRFLWIASVYLIVNFCTLGGMIGVLLRIPSLLMVTAAFSSIAIFYIIANCNTVIRIIKNPAVVLTFIVGYFLPNIHLLILYGIGFIDESRLFYWFLFNASISVLFTVSVVYSYILGDGGVRKFLYISICIIACEFLSNYINYGFTQKILFYSSSIIGKSLTLSRFMGFFGIPNMAAQAILLAVFLISSRMRAITLGNSAFFILSTALVAFTESRTSMILLIFVFTGIFLGIINRPGNFFIAPILGALGTLSALCVIYITYNSENYSHNKYFERMFLMFSTMFSDGGGGDTSTQLRIKALSQFFELISKRPLTGYGPDVIGGIVERGEVAAVSQNSWIQWAANYGVIYPIVVFLFFIFLCFYEYKKAIFLNENIGKKFTIRLFLLLVFISSFSIMDFFNIKPFMVIWGFIIGLLLRDCRISKLLRDM